MLNIKSKISAQLVKDGVDRLEIGRFTLAYTASKIYPQLRALAAKKGMAMASAEPRVELEKRNTEKPYFSTEAVSVIALQKRPLKRRRKNSMR